MENEHEFHDADVDQFDHDTNHSDDQIMEESDGETNYEEPPPELTIVEIQRERARNQRDQHYESLERFFTEVFDDEIFHMFSGDELRMRQERLKHHFLKFESSDTLYRSKCILVTNHLYVDVENRYMTVMAKIQGKINELNNSMQSCSSSTPIGYEGRLQSIIKVHTKNY